MRIDRSAYIEATKQRNATASVFASYKTSIVDGFKIKMFAKALIMLWTAVLVCGYGLTYYDEALRGDSTQPLSSFMPTGTISMHNTHQSSAVNAKLSYPLDSKRSQQIETLKTLRMHNVLRNSTDTTPHYLQDVAPSPKK